MALEQNKIQYMDDWNDVKKKSKEIHDKVEKEKDNHNVTKDYVSDEISERS